jgi:transposase
MGRRSQYPEEFRSEAVRLALAAKAVGGTHAQVARDLSLNEQTLSNWIHAERVEAGAEQR